MKKLDREEVYFKENSNSQQRNYCVDIYQKNRLFCTVYGDSEDEVNRNVERLITFYNLASDTVNLYS